MAIDYTDSVKLSIPDLEQIVGHQVIVERGIKYYLILEEKHNLQKMQNYLAEIFRLSGMEIKAIKGAKSDIWGLIKNVRSEDNL